MKIKPETIVRIGYGVTKYDGTLNGKIGVVKSIRTRSYNDEKTIEVSIFGMTNHLTTSGYYYFDENDLFPEDIISKNDLNNPIVIIKKVIFNDPATIVIWNDGTKTVVKCCEDDEFDPEKGLAMAISKKALGDSLKEVRKWTDEYYKKQEEFGCSFHEAVNIYIYNALRTIASSFRYRKGGIK